jgi:hypothetical protein
MNNSLKKFKEHLISAQASLLHSRPRQKSPYLKSCKKLMSNEQLPKIVAFNQAETADSEII